jgi:hypothetical protein
MKPLLRAILASLALAAMPAAAGEFADIQVISRSTGQPLPVYAHSGKLYVAGQPGERYSIKVANRTGGRILSVVSVDGINVVSGETAAPDQSGYVFSPLQSYDIPGWRKNASEVAAFYFTALPDSYAARTERPNHVGVIGVAVFREWSPPRPRPQPRPQLYEGPGSAPARDALSQRLAQARASEATEPASPSAELAEARKSEHSAMRQQERLGTGHGEREHSVVEFTSFRRAGSSPSESVTIHYDRHENLVARGIIPSMPRFAEPLPFPGRPRFVPDPRG